MGTTCATNEYKDTGQRVTTEGGKFTFISKVRVRYLGNSQTCVWEDSIERKIKQPKLTKSLKIKNLFYTIPNLLCFPVVRIQFTK